MDATVETTRDNKHSATFSRPQLDLLEHFNNFGLDFKYVFSRLSSPHSTSPHALRVDSVSTQFWHTDDLRAGYDDHSTGLSSVTRSSHEQQHGGQLVFLPGYSGPASWSSLTSTYNIQPEFWRRHLGTTLAASTSQFEDIKVPSAICDIFQLRIWTIGCRGDGARSRQASVNALRRDSAKLMEDYRERLNTESLFRDGDSIVRKYEVHDQEFFSIEQLVTIYVSTTNEHDGDGKNESWLGESFGRSRQVKANLLLSGH